jgi:hypothetical protein
MSRVFPVAATLLALYVCSVVASTDLATITHCHPVCRWQCTAPVCLQRCEAICQEPRCDVRCHDPSHYEACAGILHCTMHLVNGSDSIYPDMPYDEVNQLPCELSTCPWAEIKCQDRISCPYADDCEPLCEAPECAWRCTPPTLETCPKPECTLVCATPSCYFHDDINA